MQTNFLEAAMTSGWLRKLLSISCLPGHHTPETPAQCGAAEISRIGLPDFFASRIPEVSVAYHWTPAGARSSAPADSPMHRRASVAGYLKCFNMLLLRF